MNPWKKALYALITCGTFFLIVEGVGQIAFSTLDHRQKKLRYEKGEKVLSNDAINFMKRPDPVYGYVLKPGDYGSFFINHMGFSQKKETSLKKANPSDFRIVCLGESTTQGHNIGKGNYPGYLQEILVKASGNRKFEVINAGVSGWISDQVYLRTKEQISNMEPDLVILYCGWNDFQSYNPFAGEPKESYFESAYGKFFLNQISRFKSLALINEVMIPLTFKNVKFLRNPQLQSSGIERQDTYKFFKENIRKTVAALHSDRPPKIALCTIVGRWPQGDFRAKNGAVWWMQQNSIDEKTAAECLQKFNDVIRELAETQNVLLVDLAEKFQKMDRAKLQWDFAHFTDEGYELLAGEIYQALAAAGVFPPLPNPRHDFLKRKYVNSEK